MARRYARGRGSFLMNAAKCRRELLPPGNRSQSRAALLRTDGKTLLSISGGLVPGTAFTVNLPLASWRALSRVAVAL
jgi:hypothetical protein